MTTWTDVSGWPRRIPVEDASQVAAARVVATSAAQHARFATSDIDTIALAATELAENLHRHATAGELIVCMRGQEVSVLAVDRGPGVARFDRCLVDGYSTAGSLGTGLGAVTRRAWQFDAVSEVGRGTVVCAVFAPGRRGDVRRDRFDVAAMGFALVAETVNGDAFFATGDDARIATIVSDGLGHGPDAAQASRAATSEFAAVAARGPGAALAAVNARVLAGRGSASTIAAARVADFHEGGVLTSAGMGNVSVLVAGPDGSSKRVAVDHGITGSLPRSTATERLTPMAAGSILLLHTDGLSSQWTLDGREVLLRHSAQVIATALWRDHARGTDDSLVVVVKALPRSSP